MKFVILQCENAAIPKSITEAEIIKSPEILEHLENAALPIDFTELGIIKFPLKFLQ